MARGGKIFVCKPHQHSNNVMTLAQKAKIEMQIRKATRAKRKRKKQLAMQQE
jgi:hypothetical protein